MLASLVFPLLSLATMPWSYHVGATLLVGSGFLAAYAIVSRSGKLLSIEVGSAARLVSAEVFAFLAIMAAGAVVSLVLWGGGAIVGVRLSGGDVSLTDGLLGMFAIDLEVFYLARPLLSAILITLGVAAALALFGEPLHSIIRRVRKQAVGQGDVEGPRSADSPPRSRREIALRACPPYLILAASAALGIAMTLYPYTVAGATRVLGSDSWFYLEKLSAMSKFSDAFRETDRAFVLLVLFLLKTVTGLSTQWVVKLMPVVCSVLLGLSSFMLVKEGTGRAWVAALAALLSVVSAQTSLGMGAGIIANWFSLSVANFSLTMIVRSIRLRSKLAALGSLAFLFLLLASYAYMWVVVLAVLAAALVASIVCFRTRDRREWNSEVSVLSGALLGAVLVPIGFVSFVAGPLLGFQAPGLHPDLWLTQAWNLFTRAMTPEVLGTSVAALEEAFSFAGNRVDLPFLTLLSIVGLLDNPSGRRSFERIIAGAVLVPVVLTLITPAMLSTWRGLYVIPLYLTGALGAESIIQRVNGMQSPWKSRGRSAFAGTFAAYLFLSQLAYSLRALDLLIMVAS